MVYRNCILDCMYFKVHHTHPAYSAPEVDTAPQAAIPLLGGRKKRSSGSFSASQHGAHTCLSPTRLERESPQKTGLPDTTLAYEQQGREAYGCDAGRGRWGSHLTCRSARLRGCRFVTASSSAESESGWADSHARASAHRSVL